MGSMLLVCVLYIVAAIIMGAVVFWVGKYVLKILSQPVAKVIIGVVCACIVYGMVKELRVKFSWSNMALLAVGVIGILILLGGMKRKFFHGGEDDYDYDDYDD